MIEDVVGELIAHPGKGLMVRPPLRITPMRVVLPEGLLPGQRARHDQLKFVFLDGSEWFGDVISPSQLDVYLQCPRKWAYQYLDKRRSPPTKAQERGTLLHAQLEYWLTEGRAPTDPLLLNSGALTEFPPPHTPGLLTEGAFAFQVDDEFVFWGYKDAEEPGEEVYDLKSTSDLVWAKSPEYLRDEDTQAAIYALGSMALSGRDEVFLRWVYVQTRGAMAMKPVRVRVSRAAAEQVLASKMAAVRSIIRLRANKPLTTKALAGNEASCGSFGGCFFRSDCDDIGSGVQLIGRLIEAHSTRRAVMTESAGSMKVLDRAAKLMAKTGRVLPPPAAAARAAAASTPAAAPESPPTAAATADPPPAPTPVVRVSGKSRLSSLMAANPASTATAVATAPTAPAAAAETAPAVEDAEIRAGGKKWTVKVRQVGTSWSADVPEAPGIEGSGETKKAALAAVQSILINKFKEPAGETKAEPAKTAAAPKWPKVVPLKAPDGSTHEGKVWPEVGDDGTPKWHGNIQGLEGCDVVGADAMDHVVKSLQMTVDARFPVKVPAVAVTDEEGKKRGRPPKLILMVDCMPMKGQDQPGNVENLIGPARAKVEKDAGTSYRLIDYQGSKLLAAQILANFQGERPSGTYFVSSKFVDGEALKALVEAADVVIKGVH